MALHPTPRAPTWLLHCVGRAVRRPPATPVRRTCGAHLGAGGGPRPDAGARREADRPSARHPVLVDGANHPHAGHTAEPRGWCRRCASRTAGWCCRSPSRTRPPLRWLPTRPGDRGAGRPGGRLGSTAAAPAPSTMRPCAAGTAGTLRPPRGAGDRVHGHGRPPAGVQLADLAGDLEDLLPAQASWQSCATWSSACSAEPCPFC
jgi:hypothetical protein